MPKICRVSTYIYEKMCETPSDIHEHLPTLMKLATECDTIVEMGVRAAVSTWAFIEGLRKRRTDAVKRLTSVDICDVPQIGFVEAHAGKLGIDFTFVKHDSASVEIPETDLVFIDTWHAYGHLKRELSAHHSKAKKYIVLHDTESYMHVSDSSHFKADVRALSESSGYPVEEIEKGIGPAVVEFLEEHPEWVVKVHYTNNNGLTVLTRKE